MARVWGGRLDVETGHLDLAVTVYDDAQVVHDLEANLDTRAADRQEPGRRGATPRRRRSAGGVAGSPWPAGLPACGGSYNLRGNMELKLRKIGNSFGVILPAAVLEALQVREGSTLTLVPNDKGFQLTAEDAEFQAQMDAARSLMTRYRQTLRELAK